MTFIMLMHRLWNIVPQKLRNLKWAQLTILTLLATLQVSHMEESYIIISQRIELRMDVVTPAELDIMEDLCILNVNPIKKMLYDRNSICSPGVKEFFYERMGIKSP